MKTYEDELIEVLAAWCAADKDRGGEGRLPEPIPDNFQQAAEWWIDKQTKRERGEANQQTSTGGKIDPYLSRLKITLSNFLFRLSAEDRKLVARGIDAGFKWRGEPASQFLEICRETKKMREQGGKAYITELIPKMRKLGRQLSMDSKTRKTTEVKP